MTSVVYQDLVLYSTSDKFWISAVSDNKTLVIDRLTESVSVTDAADVPSAAGRMDICGVLGQVRLLAGPYLLIVTHATNVGLINSSPIYKMDAFQILPYAKSTTHLSQHQIALEKEYVSMLELVLSTPNFYFSYTYDLSHSLQRLLNISPDFMNLPLHSRGESKFIWNLSHLNAIYAQCSEAAGFLLPIIHGFVSINSVVLNGRSFRYALISRRSKHRAGTRLFTRGIDSVGNVANFVESEQIIEAGSDRGSFVQTRGSIPLFWEQWPNLRYKPRPTLLPEPHLEAARLHFEAQILEYGRQTCINLVNSTGAEGELEAAFRDLVQRIDNPNIKYEAFDFHKECSKMRWDRLSILLNRIASDIEAQGCLIQIRDGQIVSQQEGVFRTNCIDCLDRTNVVQSMIAREALGRILARLGVLETPVIPEDSGLAGLLKVVWADHADLISTQYSGTGALKTDFTRTGKRSYAGMLQDAINSATRYYKNNFIHGFRQDALDLFLGHYKVEPSEGVISQSPLAASWRWKVLTLPQILLFAIAMFVLNVITPPDAGTEWSLSLLFWGTMIIVTFATIFFHGRDFINAPRLATKAPPLLLSSTLQP